MVVVVALVDGGEIDTSLSHEAKTIRSDIDYLVNSTGSLQIVRTRVQQERQLIFTGI